MGQGSLRLLADSGAGGIPVSEDPIIYSTVNEDTSGRHQGTSDKTDTGTTSTVDHADNINDGMSKLGVSPTPRQSIMA